MNKTKEQLEKELKEAKKLILRSMKYLNYEYEYEGAIEYKYDAEKFLREKKFTKK